MDFVIDNSVVMCWLLASEKGSDQKYAEAVLDKLAEAQAWVPGIWHLEASNMLLAVEKRRHITSAESEVFLSSLEKLPVFSDGQTTEKAFNKIIALARAYNLSAYDAVYLELSLRRGLPLAILDKDLKKAAIKANVDLLSI